MTDRNVTVQIGAVLQSNFRTSFREAQREVQSLTNSIGALGARRSNAGLTSIRDAAQRLGTALRNLRTEAIATSRALGTLDRGIGRTGSAMGVAIGQTRQFTGAIGSTSRAVQSTTAALNTQVTAINASASAARAAVQAINSQIAANQRLHTQLSRPMPTPRGGGVGAGGMGGGGGGGHGAAGLAGGAMGAAAGHAARHALLGAASGALIGGHALREVFNNQAEYQHQLIMRKQQGWSNEEIAQGKAEAKRIARELKMFSETENLAVLGDLGFAMGDRHHALDALEAVQRSSARLKQSRPEMDTERNAFGAIKALEMMGHAGSKATIDDYLDKMTSAAIATGGKVTGEDYRKFAVRAGGAGNYYSQDFLTTILPSIMQELGSDTTGTSMRMVRSALIGGRMTRAAANTLNEFGLMDPNKTDAGLVSESGGLNRKGSWIGGLSRKPGRYTEVTTGRGAIKDADLLQENPYEWVQKNLKPVYESEGVNRDPKKMGQILAQMFSNSSAERAISIMLLQADRLEKDRKQILDTRKNSSFEMVLADPFLASQRLGKAFIDMTKSIGAPITAPIAHAMDAIGSAMYKIADASPETISAFVKIGGAMVGLPALAWASNLAFRALTGSMTGLFALARSPYFLAFSAAGYLIYKNWDWVKGFAEGALPGIQTGFSRMGTALDYVVSGAEKTLRFFGLIPAETDKIGSAFALGTENGKKFGDFLGLAMPALAAIWVGRTVVSIVGGMGSITTAAGIMGAALKSSLGQFGLLIAAAELAQRYGAGTGGTDKARGWLDYVDPGLGNLLYGKPSAGIPGAPGSSVYGPADPREINPGIGFNGATVQPQSYGGGGFNGLIHKSAFGGGATAQERVNSESRFSEAVRRGVFQGLQDFATNRGGGGGGTGGGGMLQNASFQAGGGFGGGGIGGSMGGGGGGFVGSGGGVIGGSGGGNPSGMIGYGANPGAYKSFLDHIAGTEGTAGGKNNGYDVTLANGKLLPGGKEQDLTKMSLDQIDAMQTGMLNHPGNKWNSSASGRYQIVQKTLRSLRSQLGLRGDEKFDEAMQDRLAATLARQRGANGSLGDEWASLRGGKLQTAIGLLAQVPKGSDTTPGIRPSDAAQIGGAGGAGGKGAQAADVALQMEGLDEDRDTGKLKTFLGQDPRGAANAWCAAFVNSSLKAVGETGTNSGVATSFLKWGKAVNADIAQKGDVAVEARGRGAGQTGGHVGLLTGNRRINPKTGELELETISGNHSNKVMRDWDPASKLQIRRSLGDDAMARAATADAAKSKPKASPGAGQKVEINAPITINPHPHQDANDIGRSAADHIKGQQADAGREMRSSTFDWAGA